MSFVGDAGTVIRITAVDSAGAVIPIGAATVIGINLKPPSGSSVFKPAQLYTNGSDGKMVYTIAPGDLDQSGLWKVQGYVEFSSVRKWHGTKHDLSVDGVV